MTKLVQDYPCLTYTHAEYVCMCLCTYVCVMPMQSKSVYMEYIYEHVYAITWLLIIHVCLRLLQVDHRGHSV
jgi:hypothetical protein